MQWEWDRIEWNSKPKPKSLYTFTLYFQREANVQWEWDRMEWNGTQSQSHFTCLLIFKAKPTWNGMEVKVKVKFKVGERTRERETELKISERSASDSGVG